MAVPERITKEDAQQYYDNTDRIQRRPSRRWRNSEPITWATVYGPMFQ